MADISTLQDLFHATSLDGTKWGNVSTGATTISYTTSGVVFTTTTTNGFASFSSLTTNYTFSNNQVLVRVPNAGNQSIASLQVLPIILYKDSNNSAYFTIAAGTLYAYSRSAGTTTQIASTAYNSSTMRWLRLRESSGSLFWEYSNNSITWTALISIADPFTMSGLSMQFQAGTGANETSTTTATIDAFDVGIPNSGETETTTELGIIGVSNADTESTTDTNNNPKIIGIEIGSFVDIGNPPPATFSSSELGSGLDINTIFSNPLGSDSFTGLDASSILATFLQSELGMFTEFSAFRKTDSDAGVGVDGRETITIFTSDNASGSDIVVFYFSSGEWSKFNEAAYSQISFQSNDIGNGSDAGAILVQTSGSESGTFVDNNTLGVHNSDQGTYVDGQSLTSNILSNDLSSVTVDTGSYLLALSNTISFEWATRGAINKNISMNYQTFGAVNETLNILWRTLISFAIRNITLQWNIYPILTYRVFSEVFDNPRGL